jgi:hypothetical protein
MLYVTQTVTTYAAACMFLESWRPFLADPQAPAYAVQMRSGDLWLRLRVRG